MRKERRSLRTVNQGDGEARRKDGETRRKGGETRRLCKSAASVGRGRQSGKALSEGYYHPPLLMQKSRKVNKRETKHRHCTKVRSCLSTPSTYLQHDSYTIANWQNPKVSLETSSMFVSRTPAKIYRKSML